MHSSRSFRCAAGAAAIAAAAAPRGGAATAAPAAAAAACCCTSRSCSCCCGSRSCSGSCCARSSCCFCCCKRSARLLLRRQREDPTPATPRPDPPGTRFSTPDPSAKPLFHLYLPTFIFLAADDQRPFGGSRGDPPNGHSLYFTEVKSTNGTLRAPPDPLAGASSPAPPAG